MKGILLGVVCLAVFGLGIANYRSKKAAEADLENVRASSLVWDETWQAGILEMEKIRAAGEIRRKELEAEEEAHQARTAEEKRMEQTLPRGEFYAWRVRRNNEEAAAQARVDERRAKQIQEDTLKELREINKKLGK